MVLMALVTTLMTSPLLSWIYPERHQLNTQRKTLGIKD